MDGFKRAGLVAASARVNTFVVAAMAVALAGAVIAPKADAQGGLGNYYGIAYFQGSGHHGTSMTLRTASMNVPNTSTDAIINDSWVINSSSLDFIEAGIEKGNATFGRCTTVNARSSFFWADLRPNSAYYCHTGAVASFNTNYSDSIRYQGSGTWNINIGSLSGTSRSSLTSEDLEETGLEETTQAGTSCGTESNLTWYDGNNTPHDGWSDDVFGQAIIAPQSNPPSAFWTNRPHALKAYSNASC